MIADEIARATYADVCKQDHANFSVLIDDTKSIAGIEQGSICIWYVSDDLHPTGVFLGVYVADSTTDKNIVAIIEDVLLRVQLDISLLGGQTYDGATSL